MKLFAKLFRKVSEGSTEVGLSKQSLLKGQSLFGKKVVLRPKSLDDLDLDYKWRIDLELTKLDASLPINLTKDEYKKIFLSDLNKNYSDTLKFAIDTKGGLHIGNCMFYNVNRYALSAEYGIMVGNRDFWGMGLGSDATSVIVEFGFEKFGLEEVYLHTLASNERAKKCFFSAGFREVGRVNRNDQIFSKMALTKESWKSLA